MAPFRLAHLSDPHLGPLPAVRLRQLGSKRALGYLNWRRSRASALGSAELVRLVADLLDQRPDHIAVTGDLVNIALPDEIRTAGAWLSALGTPDRVSVVPGNHDAYVPGALRQATAAWGAFMRSDDGVCTYVDDDRGDPTAGEDGKPPAMRGRRVSAAVPFPFLRVRGEVAIVGVSSAIATAPFSARGAFRQPQAARLADMLRAAGARGLFRVVLVHHPPIDALTGPHKRMIGSRRFLDVIDAAGAELILHGHTHEPTIAWAGDGGRVPVVCVPSASSLGLTSPRARYNIIEIAGGGGAGRRGCAVIERGATGDSDRIVEIARHVLA